MNESELQARLADAERELDIWRSLGESLSGPEGRLPEIHEKALQDLDYTDKAKMQLALDANERELARLRAALTAIVEKQAPAMWDHLWVQARAALAETAATEEGAKG